MSHNTEVDMTTEEEINMLNEDHEIWKKSHGINTADITNYTEMCFKEQLDALIVDWKATSNYDNYKYTVFSKSRTLYIDWKNSIPLCTKDEHNARLWLQQINNALLHSRQQVVKEIKMLQNIDIDNMFSVRCVMIPIDLYEGDVDHEIAGMYYFGLVVSHYMSERNSVNTAAELCDKKYESLSKKG